MFERSEAKPSKQIPPAVLDGSVAICWRNALLLFALRYARFLPRDRQHVSVALGRLCGGVAMSSPWSLIRGLFAFGGACEGSLVLPPRKSS